MAFKEKLVLNVCQGAPRYFLLGAPGVSGNASVCGQPAIKEENMSRLLLAVVNIMFNNSCTVSSVTRLNI